MDSVQKPRACYDLHLHTCWSYDATARAESYFERARELGTRCLTITDHHVMDSLPEVVEVARAYPEIVTIPSAELTVTTLIGSVDLLCYGLPLGIPEELRRVLALYHEWQRATGAAISRGMEMLGFDFSDAERLELLQSYRPARAIEVQGNTHVKNERLRTHFVERGFIGGGEEYVDLMSRVRKAAEAPPYPHVDQVVPVVKALGGMVAIAHPHGYFAQGDEARMDALRAECRLDGIECAHRAVPAEFTPRYREYCERHGLFSTGGSDCHADEDVAEVFAGHGGPDEWLDELLERVGERGVR